MTTETMTDAEWAAEFVDGLVFYDMEYHHASVPVGMAHDLNDLNFCALVEARLCEMGLAEEYAMALLDATRKDSNRGSFMRTFEVATATAAQRLAAARRTVEAHQAERKEARQ